MALTSGRGLVWPLIDRTEISSELARALESRRTIVVSGRSGVGKTRLVTDLTAGLPGLARIAGTPTFPAIPGAAISALVQNRDTVVPTAGIIAALSQMVLRRKLDTIVIDDAHDLDEVSAAALHHCSEVHDLRMVLVFREGRTLPAPFQSAIRREGTAWIQVPEATPDEVEEILRRALVPAVSTAAVEHLRRASEGNLLYLRHLVEGSVRSGALSADYDLWSFRRPPEGTPLLNDMLRRRFASLSAASRELADLLAVAGPVPADLLALLGPEAAAEELEDAELLAPPDDTDTVKLAHPVYRDWLAADLGVRRRRRLLSTLIDSVESGPRDAGTDLRLAVWRRESGRHTLPEEALSAASTAFAGRQPQLAVELATHAWEQADPGWENRGRAGLLAARCHEQLGDARRAVALYRDIKRADVPAIIKAKAAARRAECLRAQLGDQASAQRVLAEAAAEFTDNPSGHLLQTQVATGLFCDGDLSAATAITAPLLDTVTAPDVQASAAVVASRCLVHLDRPGDVVKLSARMSALFDDPDVLAVTTPEIVVHAEAMALARLGHRTAADEIIGRLSRLDLTLSSPIAGAFADFARGAVALLTDRPAEAEKAFTRSAAAAFHEAELPGYAEWCEIAALVAATDLGRSDLEERLARIVDHRQPDFSLFTPELLRAEARVRSLAGVSDEARRTWRRAAEVAASRQDWLSAVETGLDLLGAGQLDELDNVLPALPPPTSPSAQALRAGARAARSEPTELGRVADTIAPSRPARAADMWALAARTAYSCGDPAAAAFGARARRLAGSVPGLTRPRCWLPVVLSAREEEIAVLAAEGLSNPAIARKLGLATKTVENHLGHAFSKLGISGRDGLAETLGLGVGCLTPDGQILSRAPISPGDSRTGRTAAVVRRRG